MPPDWDVSRRGRIGPGNDAKTGYGLAALQAVDDGKHRLCRTCHYIACLRAEEGEVSMIEVIVLVPKREDMSSEEFRRYVDETHLPLVTRLPGLPRLLINYAQPNPDGTAPSYDGVGEDWFENPEAMQAAFTCPEGQSWRTRATSPSRTDAGAGRRRG